MRVLTAFLLTVFAFMAIASEPLAAIQQSDENFFSRNPFDSDSDLQKGSQIFYGGLRASAKSFKAFPKGTAPALRLTIFFHYDDAQLFSFCPLRKSSLTLNRSTVLRL